MHASAIVSQAANHTPFGGSGTVPGMLFASAILALLTYSFVLANVDTALATGLVVALLVAVFLLQNAIAAVRAARIRATASHSATAEA